MFVDVIQSNDTCAHIQHMVYTSIQALGLKGGHVCVVCRPAEQNGLSV